VVPIEIAVMIAIPMMVVLAPAAIAVPVAVKKTLAVMTGSHPMRTAIRRTSPISGVPLIMALHRIPVTLHPKIVRTWSYRPHDYSRGRRRPNSHSERDLTAEN